MTMRSFTLALLTALRGLRRSSFTAISVILLVGFSCGLCSSLFEGAEFILNPRLPYSNPSSLLCPWRIVNLSVSTPDIPSIVARSWEGAPGVAAVTGFSYITGAARYPRGSKPAIRVNLVSSSPNLLKTLEVSPFLGPGFSSTHPENEALISYDVWRSQFSSSEHVLGEPVALNDKVYSVAGVMPPDFVFPAELRSPTVWLSPTEPLRSQNSSLHVVMRVQPGVSLDEERVFLETAGLRDGGRVHVSLHTYGEALSARIAPALAGVRLFAYVIIFLSCAIASGMFVVRQRGTSTDTSTLFALGAQVHHLAMAMVADILLLHFCALLVAVGSTTFFYRHLSGVAITQTPWLASDLHRSSLAWHAAFLVATNASVCIAIVLSIALIHLVPSTRGGRRGRFTTYQTYSISNIFIAAEIALALVVLQVAHSFAMTEARLRSTPLGLTTDKLVLAELGSASVGSSASLRLALYNRALVAVSMLPGIEGTALASSIPVIGGSNIELGLQENGYQVSALVRSVSPGLMELENIHLEKGRFFSSADSANSEPVALVNTAFVRAYFKGVDPIGKQINMEGSHRPRIVGVIGDLPQFQIGTASSPEIDLCLPQLVHSDLFGNLLSSGSITLVMRTSESIASFRANLLKTLSNQVPAIAVSDVRSFESAVDLTFAARATLSILFRWTAWIALGMAMFGLYTLLEYRNQERSTDNAIRVALGAQQYHMLFPLLKDAATLLLSAVATAYIFACFCVLAGAGLFPKYAISPFPSGAPVAIVAALVVIASVPTAVRSWLISPAALLRAK